MFRKKKSIREELEEIKDTQRTIIRCLTDFNTTNSNIISVVDRNMKTLDVLTKNVVYRREKLIKPVAHKEELSYQ